MAGLESPIDLVPQLKPRLSSFQVALPVFFWDLQEYFVIARRLATAPVSQHRHAMLRDKQIEERVHESLPSRFLVKVNCT